MSSIPCRKCKEGLYKWIEPSREDFEHRKMKCIKCGFIDTIKEFHDNMMKRTRREKNTFSTCNTTNRIISLYTYFHINGSI